MAVLARQQRQIRQGVLVRAGGPVIGQEYFRIYDQTERLWTWWIGFTLTADWGLSPQSPLDQTVNFYIIPWWLKLADSNSDIWYVYPDVDGSPLVDVGQPTVGEGIANSPVLRVKGGTARYRYEIVGGGLDVVAA